MLQDTRQTLRSLARRPSSAILTVIVIGLAIGANTTVFSIFNGFFLRPLPFPDEGRLVMIYDSLPKLGVENGGSSIPGYLDWRTGAPSLGRGFTEDEAVPGNERVILLSHRLWRTRFGARDDLVGEDVRLDDDLFRVVGVMSERFGFPNRDVDAWVPFAYTPAQASDDQRFQGVNLSIARLKRDATLVGLNAELDAIAQGNVERLPQLAEFAEATGYTIRAQPLRDYVVGDLEQRLLILQGLVLIVLLIAAVNIANLQLSRLISRRKELAVRAALGASKQRLSSVIVIEALLLALAGACVGLFVAYGGIELVRDLFELQLDAYAYGITLAGALITAMISASSSLFVLLRDDAMRVIQADGRTNTSGLATSRWRTGIVVVQLTVGLALLASASLLTKAFYELHRQGPGFETAGVWSGAVVLPETRYVDDAAREQFFELALQDLRSIQAIENP